MADLEVRVRFAKYHGLGNDYLVIEASELPLDRARDLAPRLCHRNYGVGSDGVLLGSMEYPGADFGLRIVNPDGSEAEKSGNGLRIYARYLWDEGRVDREFFRIHTPGGISEARVRAAEGAITMTMGRASFDSQQVGVAGSRRQVVDEDLGIGGGLRFTAVTVGNPHCVVTGASVTERDVRQLGPRIEMDPRFENRTNVQLLRIVDRSHIEIQIWERGAGYTLASGSSASAAACAAHRLGACDRAISVQMPGGALHVEIDEDFGVTQTGPAVRIARGDIATESLADDAPWTRPPG